MFLKLATMAGRRKSGSRATTRATPKVAAPATADTSAAAPAPSRWRAALVTDPRLAGLALVALALLFFTALHVLHVFTAEPNFDGHTHLQFLWLTSQGILPRDGFLCPYPPTGYYLFAPLLRVLPQTPAIFVWLRGLSILPALGFVAAGGWIAHRFGRPPALAAAWVLCAMASGQLAAFWEFRFDAPAWALAWTALALLLGPADRRAMAAAAGLATLSVLLAPKHALALGGVAAAFAIHRALADRGRFAGDVLAAACGALVPVAVMTLIRPAFLDDAWDLSLMNIRAQAGSTYPVEFITAVLNLIVGYPILSLPMWAAPVLFLLQLRSLPPQARWSLGGLLAGNLVTFATLPCGYTQYVSLAWALFVPFLAFVLPAGRIGWRAIGVAAVLLLHGSWFAGREQLALRSESLLSRQMRLQQELARICPPGDLDSAIAFGHTWCRANPAYVFIDNKPSYVASVRPERRVLFSEEYYLDCLRKHPPAFDMPFATQDGQPEAYRRARIRFLRENADRYVMGYLPYEGHAALRDGRLHLFIRRDRVPFATQFTPLEGGLQF